MVEILEVNLDADTGNEEDNQEIISPEQASTDPNQPIENQPASSADTTETEVDETEEEVVAPKQPKAVEGETPREYALRLEVQRLKKERRQTEQTKFFDNSEIPTQDVNVQELLDAGYTQQDIENSKKLISVLAPSLGLVNSKETYQANANQTLDEFINAHPEYSPTIDKDDVRWGRFKDILATDYNISGKSPKQLVSVFEKVNRDVISELGEVSSSTNKRNAQIQKINSVSHSAGTKSSAPTTSKATTGNLEVSGVKFSGFDPEDLA